MVLAPFGLHPFDTKNAAARGCGPWLPESSPTPLSCPQRKSFFMASLKCADASDRFHVHG